MFFFISLKNNRGISGELYSCLKCLGSSKVIEKQGFFLHFAGFSVIFLGFFFLFLIIILITSLFGVRVFCFLTHKCEK